MMALSNLHGCIGRWGLPSAYALVLGDARWELARPICGIFEHFPGFEFSSSQAFPQPAHKPLM